MTDMAGLWVSHGTFMIDGHSNDSPSCEIPHRLCDLSTMKSNQSTFTRLFFLTD